MTTHHLQDQYTSIPRNTVIDHFYQYGFDYDYEMWHLLRSKEPDNTELELPCRIGPKKYIDNTVCRGCSLSRRVCILLVHMVGLFTTTTAPTIYIHIDELNGSAVLRIRSIYDIVFTWDVRLTTLFHKENSCVCRSVRAYIEPFLDV